MAADTVIEEVSSYISSSGDRELPSEVIKKAKHHILDTLAAIVSGSRLKPGQVAKEYVNSQAGIEEAQVAGSEVVSSAINAACGAPRSRRMVAFSSRRCRCIAWRLGRMRVLYPA